MKEQEMLCVISTHAPRVTLVTGPGFIYIRIKAEARGGHRLFTHHITAQEFLQPRRLNIYTEILGSFFQSFRSL